MKFSLIALALALFGTTQVEAVRVTRENHEMFDPVTLYYCACKAVGLC
jgi:hypothetical protein